MSHSTFLVFPGQGSQHSYMLSKSNLLDLASSNTFHEPIELLDDLLGCSFMNLVESEDTAINDTANTQPILLFISYLHLFKLLDNLDLDISFLAGHSLGEYTALVCSKSISLIDGLKIVAKRGSLMKNTLNGSMSAILGLDPDIIIEVCKEISNNKVQAANLNSPIQTVISGDISYLEEIEKILKEKGARKVIRLNVSVAAHSSLMRDASEEFKKHLNGYDFKQPNHKILHNVDASSCNSISDLKSKLVKQLYMPVQWVNIMKNVNKNMDLIEVGPGKVLSGLAKANNVNSYFSTSSNTFYDNIDRWQN